jgi:hypothetical protein
MNFLSIHGGTGGTVVKQAALSLSFPYLACLPACLPAACPMDRHDLRCNEATKQTKGNSKREKAKAGKQRGKREAGSGTSQSQNDVTQTKGRMKS